MSIFLAKIPKIRGGWGLCPRTPLPNPGYATGKAYEVLPPLRNFGLATPLTVAHTTHMHTQFCCAKFQLLRHSSLI